MRKAVKIALGVATASLVVALVGPRPRLGRVDVDGARADVPASPDQLDAWLELGESAHADLVPGTAAGIRWARDPGQRTATAIVFLHGYSASRQEIEPVLSDVGAELGANVLFTRLRGHGRGYQGLAEATAEDWVFDVEQAIQAGRVLGDRVVVVGVSTGATLGALALLDQPDVAGLIALSPNFGPTGPADLLLLPWARIWAPPIVGDHSWEPRNAEQGRYWTTTYPADSVIEMMEVVHAARTAPWEQLSVPTLVFRSDQDDVVVQPEIDAWASEIGAPVRVIQAAPGESGHVLAGAICAPSQTVAVTAELVQWIGAL